MTIDNRAQAQQRSDRIAQFRAELDCLQREGVLQLAADQQAQVQGYHQRLLGELASRFDIDHSRQAHQLSLGMRIASLLGALALAASLFFLFYRFWGLFGSTSQVAILIAAPLLGLLLTAALQRLDDSGYFSKLAALLTFTAFVLNLVMLGQIFNITPTDQALLAWAALALLLAYACELRLLLGLGLLSATAFCASRLHSWDGLDWLACIERPVARQWSSSLPSSAASSALACPSRIRPLLPAPTGGNPLDGCGDCNCSPSIGEYRN